MTCGSVLSLGPPRQEIFRFSEGIAAAAAAARECEPISEAMVKVGVDDIDSAVKSGTGAPAQYLRFSIYPRRNTARSHPRNLLAAGRNALWIEAPDSMSDGGENESRPVLSGRVSALMEAVVRTVHGDLKFSKRDVQARTWRPALTRHFLSAACR